MFVFQGSRTQNPSGKMVQKSDKRDQRIAIILLMLIMIFGALYLKFTDILMIPLKDQIQINQNPNDYTKNWIETPIPIDINVRVFALQNPREFVAGQKAKLRELGPYTYNLKVQKDIQSFSQDGKVVKFYDIQSYSFKPEASVGKLTDRIHTINFPVYAMSSLVLTIVDSLPMKFALKPIVFGLLGIFFAGHGESTIKTLTVGQLLNGYRFGVLDTMDQLAKPLGLLGIQLPETGMPDNKFGFLWTKNFTKNGPFDAYTGQADTDLLRLVSYKNKRSLDFYDGPICNAINGTEGSTLGLNVQRSQVYGIFNSDTCRTIDLSYQKDTWVNGLRTYRFRPDRELFGAPRKNPLNRCYCTTPDNENYCDGVFDLTRCLKAPLAYSFPHFLHANPLIKNNVQGLRADLAKHEPYVDVEPLTGSPLNAADKIQINAMIRPIPYLSGFRNVRRTILPLIWIEKSAVIDEQLTLQLRMSLYPVYLIYILIYTVFFGAIFALIIHLGRSGYKRFKNGKHFVKINTDQESRSSRADLIRATPEN